VRDPESLRELAKYATKDAVRLVPDTAFGVKGLLDALPPSASNAGVDPGRPYVVIQCSRGLQPIADEILRAVEALDAAGVTIVEVPVSPVLGDRHGLLGDLGSATVRIDPMPDPIALARLVAGAQAVVAHSLHCSLVALAHGVPVFRAGMPEGTKYHALATLPGVALVAEHDDLAGQLAQARPGAPSTRVQELVSQVDAHWDRLAEVVSATDAAAAARRRLAARRAIAFLPGAIAGEQHTALQAAQDAEEARRAAERERDRLADRQRLALSNLAEANERAVALTGRLGALEVELTRSRGQSAADRKRAADELDRRKHELAEARRTIKGLERKAAAYDRMRRRFVVRAGLAALRVGRRVMPVPGRGKAKPDTTRRTLVATEAEHRALGSALLHESPGSTRTTGPLVSIIILNRNGAAHLRRLLPALHRTTYTSFEIVLVDNASDDGSPDIAAAGTGPITVIRNEENVPFADANNQAVEAATGDLLLFLNNDIEPLGPGWLGRLVDTLEQLDAAAVGARLVYPRRPNDDTAGDKAFADLTLQHGGIAFVPGDGVPTGRNLGTGTDPRSAEARRVEEVAGVTAACMLIRRTDFVAVGGFTTGYVYGTEDVDLCMKLQAAGRRIVYDGGAVLWHHEYGTQNAQGREWKKRNRVHNRQLFVDLWGPQVFREVLRDRILGRKRWSMQPLHVAITLTKDDPKAGWGDYYTAHELGDALGSLGWTVSYLERHRDRWYNVDRSVDVIISLLDAFDVRKAPRGVVTVAWVRDWTERWLRQPWFDEFDIVLASSARSRELILEQSTRVPAIMPLATNPDRFKPTEPVESLRSDLLFVGNSWGAPREIEAILPQVADGFAVAIHGRGWDETELSRFDRGPLPYEQLPAAYASARVVLDDTAGPTLPYGAVNARVFDALAAGALVVSDNAAGAAELFGDALPVARTADELRARITWATEHPDEAKALAERLRDEVLEKHTYAHRAAEIRDHLLGWVDAQRYAILVGIPTWDVAHTWGDYHFARAIQRQLERRGHPTRIHLLDEWGRSPAARADVAIHLHGLSDHRVRPSQLNVLWIISHPDRITPRACDKYDLVLAASDTFAEELASRVRAPVASLHQATDPDRFFPDPTGPEHELLFVANTRNTRRSIIEDLTPTAHDLAVYGKGWTAELIDPVHARGDHIPNEQLRRYYSSAMIVLNDHWADMRAHGFLSNRLYDALACGAFVISDAAVGIDEEFEGTVTTYADRNELRALVDRYLDDPVARRAMADRGRGIVLERHTFAHRVERLIALVGGVAPAAPSDLGRWADIAPWLDRRRLAPRTGTTGDGSAAVGAAALPGS
jgi:GT2 family glycosyltransferase/spore maturation protein CgeB